MGLYYRKSKKVGPFRFTLSKSGISTSVGGKGLRITRGPRGTHLTTGYGGFTYRHKLNSIPELGQSIGNSALDKPETAFDSASVEVLADESMAGFAEPFAREARARVRTNLFTLFFFLSGIFIFAMVANSGSATLLGAWMIFGIVGLPTALIHYLTNRVTLKFEVPEEHRGSIEAFTEAAAQLASSGLAYHTDKGNRAIKPRMRMPFGRKSDVQPLELRAGKETLFCFPDRMLVISPRGAAAIPINQIKIIVASENLTASSAPADAHVIATRWQHTRADGLPDRRYSNNPAVITIELASLQFTSPSGVNERFLFSNTQAAYSFADLVKGASRSI